MKIMKAGVACFALICLLPRPADACSCIEGTSPCASVWQASGIVEATVVAIEDLGVSERLVRLRDVRPVIGEPRDTVVTAAASSMCGYTFAVGMRYIIVMHKRSVDGRATTSSCSPTQPAAWGGPFKSYLNDLSKSLSSPTLERRLTPAVLKGRALFEDGRPASGALIVVEGADEQRCPRLRVGSGKANANGEFALELLEHGSYELTARLDRLSAAPVRLRLTPSLEPVIIVLRPTKLSGPLAPGTHDIKGESSPGPQVLFTPGLRVAFHRRDLERFSPQDLKRLSRPGPRAPFTPRTSNVSTEVLS